MTIVAGALGSSGCPKLLNGLPGHNDLVEQLGMTLHIADDPEYGKRYAADEDYLLHIDPVDAEPPRRAAAEHSHQFASGVESVKGAARPN